MKPTQKTWTATSPRSKEYQGPGATFLLLRRKNDFVFTFSLEFYFSCQGSGDALALLRQELWDLCRGTRTAALQSVECWADPASNGSLGVQQVTGLSLHVSTSTVNLPDILDEDPLR